MKQEDEIRKRVEEREAERQRRIAERTAASAGSGATKKLVNPRGVSSPLKKKTTGV